MISIAHIEAAANEPRVSSTLGTGMGS